MPAPARRIVVVVLLPLAIGCGGAHPDRTDTSGSVTFKGRPLIKGTISFVPIEGTESPSSGAQILDGKYSIPAEKGPMSGKFRVEITSHQETDEEIEDNMSPTGKSYAVRQIIPARYNTESELTVAVTKGGANTFDFALEADPAPQPASAPKPKTE